MLIDLKLSQMLVVSVDAPAICPRCGRDLVPQQLFVKEVIAHQQQAFTATIMCSQCRKPIYLDIVRPYNKTAHVEKVYPSVEIFDIPKGVDDLYPSFLSTYKEAAIAEARGLSDICGMGYRKALEKLVKQYALKVFPDNSEAINAETLMQTVNRINNPRIQALAKASTWLGNDQTHPQTFHPDYTVADMKAFIKALCYHILMEEEVSRAQKLIAEPRK